MITKISNWNKIDKTKKPKFYEIDRWKNRWIDNFENKFKQTNKLKEQINKLKNDLNKYNK